MLSVWSSGRRGPFLRVYDVVPLAVLELGSSLLASPHLAFPCLTSSFVLPCPALHDPVPISRIISPFFFCAILTVMKLSSFLLSQPRLHLSQFLSCPLLSRRTRSYSCIIGSSLRSFLCINVAVKVLGFSLLASPRLALLYL